MPRKYKHGPKMLSKKAAKVFEDRGVQLGSYKPLYSELAVRWSMVAGVTLSPAQAARMLIEMKLARWNAGFDEDHAIDAANYAFIAASLEGESE